MLARFCGRQIHQHETIVQGFGLRNCVMLDDEGLVRSDVVRQIWHRDQRDLGFVRKQFQAGNIVGVGDGKVFSAAEDDILPVQKTWSSLNKDGDLRSCRFQTYQLGASVDLSFDLGWVKPDQMFDRLVGGADGEVDFRFLGSAIPTVMRLDAQPIRPGSGARRANGISRRGECALPRMPAGPNLLESGAFQGPDRARHACIGIGGRRRPEQANDMSDVAAILKIAFQRERRVGLRGQASELDQVLAPAGDADRLADRPTPGAADKAGNIRA